MHDVRKDIIFLQNEVVPKKWTIWNYMPKENISYVGHSSYSTFIADMQLGTSIGGNLPQTIIEPPQ